MNRIAFLFVGTLAVAALFAGCEGDEGPVGPPGPSSMLGFASVDASVPDIFNFGGAGTDSVTVTGSGGRFVVTFHGSYPGVTSRNDVTVLATISDTQNYHVASASMDEGSASSTSIVTVVWVWSTNTNPNTLDDEDFSVLVLR